MDSLELNFKDDSIRSPNGPRMLKRTSTKLLSKRKFSTDVAYEMWRGKVQNTPHENPEKPRGIKIISRQTIPNSQRESRLTRSVELPKQKTLRYEDIDILSQNESSSDQYKNSYSGSILKFRPSPKRKCNSILNKLTHLLFRKKMYNPNCKNGCPKCNCNENESIKGYINFQNNIYHCSYRK